MAIGTRKKTDFWVVLYMAQELARFKNLYMALHGLHCLMWQPWMAYDWPHGLLHIWQQVSWSVLRSHTQLLHVGLAHLMAKWCRT